MRIVRLTEDTRKDILDRLLKRSPNNYSEYETVVADIITDVRTNGDQAVFACTKKFDKWDVTAETIRVTAAEIEEAFAAIEEEFVMVMNRAAANIKAFHEKQLRNSWIDTRPDGSLLGQRILPLATSGVYVPGGKAAYPSSVLMNVIPARVAGVKKIVMTTPASADGKVNPGTLVAAKIAGVDEIYKVGGAQAIAAMAFGTQSIPKVDKITGPGNIFVALAKKACFGYVSIDSIAGPSEILVIADESANPRYVAADLLSQAEHDPMASSILVTTSEPLIEAVNQALREQTDVLPKKEIIEQSLASFGTAILTDTMDEAIEISNEIAPEHLELQVENAIDYLPLVKNAGSVFLGYTTCESIGDYFGGTNHVLPTSGTARFSSALGVDAFTKKSSYMYYSDQALQKNGHKIIRMAQEEDLEAHANAVRIRLHDASENQDEIEREEGE